MERTLLGARFRVEGPPIGEGLTGVVWPATDVETGRAVAVKVIHPSLSADQAARSRIERGVGQASRVAHASVLPVVGLWADSSGLLVVTPRIRGAPASALDAPLDPRAALALADQIADALVAAHGAGVVHGDVRPGNVLLGPEGALLYDFGLPSLRPGETAPEVLRGSPATERSDLYGLGVVLYRALAGRAPFSGDQPFAILGSQNRPPPRPPGPRGVADLAVRLLDPDPARRPPSAIAARAAIAALLRRPDRRITPDIAPILLRGAWVVHGVDPQTGERALFASDLGARGARRLAGRLRSEGWQAEASKAGIGLPALAVMAPITLASAVALPVIGPLVVVAASLRIASWGCRPDLRSLPAASTALPPRRLSPNVEVEVTAGILLLLTAVALLLVPPLAIVPAILCALAVSAWRAPVDPRDLAESARVRTALAEARRGIAELPLDAELGLLGEIETLSRRWESGSVAGDRAIAQAEALLVRPSALDYERRMEHYPAPKDPKD